MNHAKGLALDLIVGVRQPKIRVLNIHNSDTDKSFLYTCNPKRFEVAEWVVNNHASLDIRYVMWGEKIWTVSINHMPKRWNDWHHATLPDRGGITAKH